MSLRVSACMIVYVCVRLCLYACERGLLLPLKHITRARSHDIRIGMAPTRQDKTRLCHIHCNPSSQGGGQVLEKRNSCTDTCMTRRLVVNSWQMPLAIKHAQASRHATCHFTHYRPANAAIQCLRFLSRLNVRFDVLQECLQKCLYQGSGSTG